MPTPIVEQVKRARAVGVPLIGIQTADQIACVKALVGGINGKSPIVLWDQLSGLSPGNDLGEAALASLIGPNDPAMFRSLPEVLLAAKDLPERAALVIQNAHQFIDAGPVIQGAMNARDIYKNTRRTLIMVGTQFKLPAEIAQDVIVLTEELPEPGEISAIAGKLFTDTKTACDEADLARVTDALRGLPAFAVEQAAALSITKDRTVDVADCWERKRSMVNNTPGITLEKPTESFEDIRGLTQVKFFMSRYLKGRKKVTLIAHVDEIEKSLAGSATSGGDNTGVAQDAHRMLLQTITQGALLGGPPGSGKTIFPRALASTYQLPLATIDLGGAKGPHVGESERMIRQLIQTIESLSGGHALWFGTFNRMDTLSPELCRRFRAGIWMFDLPNQEEREAIADLYFKKFNVGGDASLFGDGWSAANIADCIEMAWALDCPIQEASSFIVPAAIQDPDGLARLRALATGRFLAASYPGMYRAPVKAAVPQTRRIEMED